MLKKTVLAKFLDTLWFSFVMSALITLPVGFVLTAYNVGFTPGFVPAFVANLLIGLVVSTFVSIAAYPMALRIVGVEATTEPAQGAESTRAEPTFAECTSAESLPAESLSAESTPAALTASAEPNPPAARVAVSVL